jgi:hypothetical protein
MHQTASPAGKQDASISVLRRVLLKKDMKVDVGTHIWTRVLLASMHLLVRQLPQPLHVHCLSAAYETETQCSILLTCYGKNSGCTGRCESQLRQNEFM